jgi:HAD superfamily hydrolase (TIGR01509 family)
MTALLFDLDGTLADTDPLHQRAWIELLAQHGITADAAYYARHIVGRRNAEIVQAVLPNLSEAEGLAAADHKEARFRQLAGDDLKALAGLTQLLARSERQGWRTALVTNAPRANARHVLSALGLHFDVAIFGEDLPLGKPDPLPYREALKQLGVSAHDAIAFEDSPSGVRSSVGAGIDTVGILTGHPAAELHAAGAVVCVTDFAAPELGTWLDARSA